MATRNILDTLGNVIGTLTLPDATTEDQWTLALSPYATEPADPVSPTLVQTFTISETSPVSTSSSTPAVIGALTKIPPAGRYLINFNGSISTSGASAAGNFGVYVDGVALADTIRPISCNLQLLGGLVTVSLNQIGLGTYTGTEVVLNGSQTVDIRYKSTNGGTIAFAERVMTLMKVG